MIATTATVTAAGLSGIRCSWAVGQRGVIEVVAERERGEGPRGVLVESVGESGERGQRPNATGISFAQSSFASRFLYGSEKQ